MKIAVSSKGKDLTSEIDERFGRAAFFIIIDSETLDFKAIENTQNLNLPGGAGIQSSKAVVGTGAEILITCNCGPKAFAALSSAGIKISLGCTGRILDAVQKFNNGLLSFATEANVKGHWI